MVLCVYKGRGSVYPFDVLQTIRVRTRTRIVRIVLDKNESMWVERLNVCLQGSFITHYLNLFE